MFLLISKTIFYLTKNSSFYQTNLKIQYIIVWFGYLHKFGEFTNFDLYQIDNKTIAIKKLEVEVKMQALCYKFGQPVRIYMNLFKVSQMTYRSKV